VVTKIAKVLGAKSTFGSSTIKRNGAIMKGTRGKGIAELSSVRDDVKILENKKAHRKIQV
jgi:hypothetical protein